MKLARIDKAANFIFNRFELSSSFSIYKGGTLRAHIETVAHELGHWIALYGKARLRRKLDGRIQTALDMQLDAYANRHEALACAIEVIGLRKLGIRVDVHRLAQNAASMMRGNMGGDAKGTHKLVRKALKTKRARRGARRFVEIIEKYAR